MIWAASSAVTLLAVRCSTSPLAAWTCPKAPKSTLVNERFMALHMMIERIRPDEASRALFTYSPGTTGTAALLLFVIALGISTYAIRGLYWSILDDCHIPLRAVGLGIGVISMVGYTPDIFLPQINAALVHAYPGITGAQLYFDFIAVCGIVGAHRGLPVQAARRAGQVIKSSGRGAP